MPKRFYHFPAQHLRLFPNHVDKYRKGDPVLLGVNFHNILYVESEADLLRPEEHIIENSLLEEDDILAPFGLLIALFKVELFIWDSFVLFSKS